ncbi:MAG: VOC family protein [Alphaproteobacteria bacterium]|nr:VOC family protein [Alphaproteobacteria bacterium]
MTARIAQLTYLVRDYDEAIAWFARALGFALVENTELGGGKRWVLVAPQGDKVGGETKLLLAKAATPAQATYIGKQGGGRVFLFLHTDDFARDHALFKSRGVRFVEEPRHETYGTVAVFEDLYGNRWDLIEATKRVGQAGRARQR